MIELREAGCERGGRSVLEGVTFAVPRGGWTTLIGANGAGKTTLLLAVAGSVAHSGAIAVGGEDPRRMPSSRRARQIAIVWQSPLLPPDMTVAEYVMLGRTPYLGMLGRAGSGDERATREAMRRLDLGRLATRRLGALSGGERQRATLARALAQEAPVLILDEPTSALDVGRQQEALELVGELRSERQLTVLGAMHDLTLAGQYADELALLGEGRLVHHGPPAEVLTPELIATHYRAHVEVVEVGGTPGVLPVRPGVAA
ncbi:MAG TPA: ABC transporter ATP-binding protein [Solirubrobacterales bacterium]|nr:ABC transporter ATP-binding protein [Solirubrobacterales bacterium]